MEKNVNKKELHVSDAVRLDWVAVQRELGADDAKPLDFQSAAGVIGDNAWWCGVLLSDGFLPVGVREQEVLYKLQAAWTLASQEASIEMSYFHTNLPLYKRVSDPSPRPTHNPAPVALLACQAFSRRWSVEAGNL